MNYNKYSLIDLKQISSAVLRDGGVAIIDSWCELKPNLDWMKNE